MRFIKYLKEEYLGITRDSKLGDTWTYYVNPDSSDLKELGRSNMRVRFIADNKNQKLYIWGALAANHFEGQDYLIKQGFIEKPKKNRVSFDSNFLNGMGDIKGNKLSTTMSDCHDFLLYPDEEEVNKKMTHSWSWLKQYFVNLVFIKKLKHLVKTGVIS